MLNLNNRQKNRIRLGTIIIAVVFLISIFVGAFRSIEGNLVLLTMISIITLLILSSVLLAQGEDAPMKKHSWRKIAIVSSIVLIIGSGLITTISFYVAQIRERETAIDLAKQLSFKTLPDREELKGILKERIPYLSDKQLLELKEKLKEESLDSSYVLQVMGGIESLSRNSTANEVLAKEMKRKMGVYEVVGWKSKELVDHKYLVSYTIKDSSGEAGWYFEVYTKENLVRYINRDSALFSHYNKINAFRRLETGFETYYRIEKSLSK